ncbi:MAG: hypothetical protein ACRYGF_15130 [Janthinobacterium lividum]
MFGSVHLPTRREFLLPALLSLGLISLAAHAQVNSNSSGVTLNATLPESMSVSATPAAVSFALVQGAAVQGSAPVTITTSWVASAGRANVNLFAWFSNPVAALTDGGTSANNIPAAEVFGQVATGLPTFFTAFNQTTVLGAALGGLPLFTQTLLSTNRSGSRVDNLVLKIDLTNHAQLPAGTYTGTLNLQAQAL